MNVWMWLLIGFLTGLVVAAIISMLRGSASKNEDEKDDTAAKLAKSEVKVTVLEDKLRLAEADNLTLQTKMEMDYKDQLDTAEAEYRANVAIVESENLALTAALADAKLELEKIKAEKEAKNIVLTAALADAKLELEKNKAENEAEKMVLTAALVDAKLELEKNKAENEAKDIIMSDSAISTIGLNGYDDNLEDLIVVAENEEIIQESIDGQEGEEFDSSERSLLPTAIIAESIIGENEEVDALVVSNLTGEEEDFYDKPQLSEEISETQILNAEDSDLDDLANAEALAAYSEEVEEYEHLSPGEIAVGTSVIGAVFNKVVENESNSEYGDNEELHAVAAIEQVEVHTPKSFEEISAIESADLITDPEQEIPEILLVDEAPDQFEEIQQTADSRFEPDTIEDYEGAVIAEVVSQELEDDDQDKGPIVIDEEFAENSHLMPAAVMGAGLAVLALAANEGNDEVRDVGEPVEGVSFSDLGEESGADLESEINHETDTNKPATVEEIEEGVVVAVPEWPEDDSVWQGEYFNNMKLEGEPVLVRQDADVNFDWDYGSPAPELNVDGFSVRWTRKADLPPGLYRFTVTSDDGARLWVNERLVISAWYDHSQMTFRREMELPGGPVNLRLEYYEKDMTAIVQCFWERIG